MTRKAPSIALKASTLERKVQIAARFGRRSESKSADVGQKSISFRALRAAIRTFWAAGRT